MAARGWQVGTVCVVLLVVAAACRQLVGISDEPPMALVDAGPPKVEASGEPEAASIVYAGASCEACLEHSCGPQATACAGGSACSGLEGCLGQCDGGDPTCRARCVDQHRIGPDPLEIQLAACLAAHCEQPCGIVCGGFAEDFGPDAAAGCQTCVLDNACSTFRTCGTDPECQALAACVLTNQFGDRRAACQAPFDAGRDAYASAVIAAQACQNACALGSQWYCVGSPPMFSGTGKPTPLFLTLYDQLSKSTPIADASVVVCSPEDPTCSQILFSGTTGADGGVTVTIPAGGLNTGATGYIRITGNGLVPELFFWGFPLSEPSLTEAVPTVSKLLESVVASSAAGLGVPVDTSSHAIVALGAVDCQITTAPGVQFSISPSDRDAGTHVFYFSQSSLSPTADSTDSTGAALIVNVPPGPITVTARPTALGGRASSVVQGFARPGAVTVFVPAANQ